MIRLEHELLFGSSLFWDQLYRTGVCECCSGMDWVLVISWSAISFCITYFVYIFVIVIIVIFSSFAILLHCSYYPITLFSVHEFPLPFWGMSEQLCDPCCPLGLNHTFAFCIINHSEVVGPLRSLTQKQGMFLYWFWWYLCLFRKKIWEIVLEQSQCSLFIISVGGNFYWHLRILNYLLSAMIQNDFSKCIISMSVRLYTEQIPSHKPCKYP